MSKYIFKKVPSEEISKFNFDPDITSVKMIVDGDKTWPELMQDFVHFLNGCGYQVPNGEWMSAEESTNEEE